MRVILEADAPPETKRLYEKLKTAFQTKTLPLFFAYIGSYPEYLRYISEQIITNVSNPLFTSLTQLLQSEILEMAQPISTPSVKTGEWVQKYRYTSAYYNFQQDLQKNYHTNVQLALVFIALREAVKGWAVATKKLTSNDEAAKSTAESISHDFIFTQDIPEIVSIQTGQQKDIQRRMTDITTPNSAALEKNLLGLYFQLCRNDFEELIKTEQFLLTRVQLEKMLLTSIHTFPNLITSPINVVLELTQKYPDFSELLYLISEHFPTYTVQRVLFSGYMLKNLS